MIGQHKGAILATLSVPAPLLRSVAMLVLLRERCYYHYGLALGPATAPAAGPYQRTPACAPAGAHFCRSRKDEAAQGAAWIVCLMRKDVQPSLPSNGKPCLPVLPHSRPLASPAIARLCKTWPARIRAGRPFGRSIPLLVSIAPLSLSGLTCDAAGAGAGLLLLRAEDRLAENQNRRLNR